MWNLLANTDISTTYRPTASAASGGTFTNPTFAYDTNPATFATCIRDGSAVSGTPIDTTFTYSGFATLAKANFTDVFINVLFHQTFDLYVSVTSYISSMQYIEYSVDGGTTWLSMGSDLTTYHNKRDTVLPIYNAIYAVYPASSVSLGSLEYGLTPQDIPPGPPFTGTLLLQKQISSVSFTTGLQDLQIRSRCNTLTTGGNKSKSTTKLYDIKAVVK